MYQTPYQGNKTDAVPAVTKLIVWSSPSPGRVGTRSYKARTLAFLPGSNSKINTGFHINYSSHFQNICSLFSLLVIITEAIIRLQRYIDHISKIQNQGTRSDQYLKQRQNIWSEDYPSEPWMSCSQETGHCNGFSSSVRPSRCRPPSASWGKPLELCLWCQKLQMLLNQLQMQLNQMKLLPQIHQSPFFIFHSGWDLPEVRNNTHLVSADLRLGHVGCD